MHSCGRFLKTARKLVNGGSHGLAGFTNGYNKGSEFPAAFPRNFNLKLGDLSTLTNKQEKDLLDA